MDRLSRHPARTAAPSARRPRPAARRWPDRHVLYEASVQSVDWELRFLRRLFRKHTGASPTRLREDFCGTAALACAWAGRHPSHRAWGIDLDPGVLAWARRAHLARMDADAARRVVLRHADVLRARTPPVDLLVGLNFSYSVFTTRRQLGRWMRRAHASLDRPGMLVIDAYGGTHTMTANTERRRVPASVSAAGEPVPPFTYVWEHAHFDVLSHRLRSHIHFEFPGGRAMRRAFTYDWRLWTLPELRELLAEAGFDPVEVYLHGWTPKGASDDIYRRRTRYENAIGWVAYLVAVKR